ncbi:twitching motility protein PilT [Candidatus Thiomargarita nelsonii]|uniref:Ribonuclease VapC n=1 Tax=Candidatus Thiomargarita nelsonii TaxID=1003181 RepID=A0A0A6PJY1_9GAMM|nr:twitching motility protein PilT [Candidatus Thiomargarita nelsonii]
MLVDVNLLLYATVADYPQHFAARTWLEEQFNGNAQVGLPWLSLLGFVRIVTNPRIFDNPLSISTAWTQVDEWLALPSVWIPQPTEQHAKILGKLLCASGTGGNLVSDAHLAALSIEHELVLCSTDRDFTKFPDLNWYNPLSTNSLKVHKVKT